MSPVSRGRKKKPDRRSRRLAAVPDEDALVRNVIAAFRPAVTETDPVQVEAMVSGLLGTVWQQDPLGRDQDGAVLALVASAGRRRDPSALALLRALAAIADSRAVREAAGSGADILRAAGVTEPDWVSAIGRPVVRDCWRLTDCYGDMVTLACVFGYGRRRHCLTALIDSGDGDPWISELALLDQPARILRELRKVAADSAPIITLEQLDPAVAREVLEDGMAGTDRTWRQDVPPSVVELRAVALARCRSLPEPDRTVRPLAAAESGDSERAALVAEFLASPEAAGLAGGDSIRYCARLIVDFGADADGGRPLRVSPNKIERFLHDWVPRKVLLDEADRDAMPVVIAAWARWAAGRSDLPAEAIAEVINAADECGSHFAQGYDDPENVGPARALLSGLELTGDPARTQDALDRRTFAMPYVGTRIGNDDYPQLNPGDPDDRRLLIEGEHPEYHGAGSRAVAGVNPDLHIALHEMVASQLWDDDPPEAWQAAKRLRDRGLDRHEILHRLADVAVQHLHGALTEGTPADAAAYARGLSKLAPGRKVKAGRTRTAGITPESVLLVKVSLRGAKPPIWRRLRLPSQMTLAMLHEALQAAFGWTDSHLHRFEADGRRFSHPDFELDEWGEPYGDERLVSLSAVFTAPGDRMRYEYDFGDSWEHDIVVEEVLPADGRRSAVCVGGRRAGPPEDCGGVWGYAELCTILADPSHPEHSERMAWAGGGVDPARFDQAAINAALSRMPVPE